MNDLPCLKQVTFIQIVVFILIDSWKALIRIKLHQAVGLVSGALFLLMVSVITHSLTKQKLFTVITKLCALGTGITGGTY